MRYDNVKITFYTRECGEIPSLGKEYQNLTAEEAVKKYKKFTDMCKGPELGLCYKNPDSEIYDETEIPILSFGKENRTMLECIRELNECPAVQEAFKKIVVLYNR